MNLQQKYLLLFSDFRDLRDEATRLGDEVIRLRAQLDEERTRFDALTERYVTREESLNNRMLAEQYRQRPPAEPRPVTEPSILNPKQWVQKQRSVFADKLRTREATLASDERTNPTRTN